MISKKIFFRTDQSINQTYGGSMIRSLLYYLIRYRQKISKSHACQGHQADHRMAARQQARARADRIEGHVALYKWSKFKKKKFGGGGAGAVNYFAEFSLNSRFLFSSVIFFQDVWAKSSGLGFFTSVLDGKPSRRK